MAKRHKLAGTGLGVDTALSADDLRSICLAAAPQATGTMWSGQQKITLESNRGGDLLFSMRAPLLNITRLTFLISITESGDRRQLLSTIAQYQTSQTVVFGFIPVGAKTMVGHHVYIEFLQLVARTIQSADPTAVARLSVGADQRASIPRVTPAPSAAAAPVTPIAPAEPPTAEPPTAEPPPAEPPTLEPPPAEPAPEIDRTVFVERRAPRVTWTLRADDGTVSEVATRTVLGRDPQPLEASDATIVVGVDDSTVSAIHALVELRDGQLLITDLESSNGTVVLDGNGHEQHCPAGVPVAVTEGSAIELGAYTLVAHSQKRRAG